MTISITFSNGTITRFDPSTIVSYKYSDRYFAVITNHAKSLYLYNMNDISKVEIHISEETPGTVMDYEQH